MSYPISFDIDKDIVEDRLKTGRLGGIKSEKLTQTGLGITFGSAVVDDHRDDREKVFEFLELSSVYPEHVAQKLEQHPLGGGLKLQKED